MKNLNKKNIIGLLAIIGIYAIAGFLINIGVIDSYLFLNIVIIGVNIILAVSLNLITGFTGQFSLGHAAFMSIGAYTSAIMTTKLGLPFIPALMGAIITSAIAGIVIGIPTLRLKGDYLAIATLGFGEIIKIVGLNNEYIGGAMGLNDIPQYTNWTWLYFFVVVTILIINNFLNSYNGRACISIKEDEVASEAMGINTTYYKVLVFTLGAIFAGIAGGLHAHFVYYIKPDSFGFMKSIDILVIVVFGGLGSIKGSIMGAILLSIISLLLQGIPELRMVVYSVILFLIMVYRPQGIMGKSSFNFFKKRSVLNGISPNK